MQKLDAKYFIIIIVVLCFLSRLPFLTNPNMAMDSDECVVGLMAKHKYEGKHVPMFFYGQAYGFSAIEVTLISVFYTVFGVTDTAVKLAMLLIWTIGIVLFFKSLQNLNSNNLLIPFLVTLLFVFAPSWYIWSMKARGGYLTSFVLFNALLYLITKPRLKASRWLLAIAGLMGLVLVFMFESQPLWLVGLLPILVYKMVKLDSWKAFIALLIGAGIGILFFGYSKLGLSNFWAPPVIRLENLDLGSTWLLPEKIFHSLNGHYVYANNYTPGIFAAIWACFFTILAFVSCIWIYVNKIRTKSKISFLFICAISVTFTIGYLVFIRGDLPRYQLPLTGCLLLMLFELVKLYENSKWVRNGLFAMVIIGALSMFEFKPLFVGQNDKLKTVELVNALNERKVQYVFCEDGLLQWQIIFYAKEEIKCRYVYNQDRYQPYVDAVNETYLLQQEKTAIVGFYPTDLGRDSLTNVSNLYYIYENPKPQSLRDLGFELPL